jgi:hypothetical protein
MTQDRLITALSWAFAIIAYGLAGLSVFALGVCWWVQVWN